MAGPRKKNDNGKRLTRYTHEDVKEPGTPETGHTKLLPAEEITVTLPMENGWTKKIEVSRLAADEKRAVIVDMDPEQDPVLFWAGKRNKREIPVLPLQRTEIVSESRLAQIINRAKEAAVEKSGATRGGYLFADLERELRESDRSKRVEFYTHDEGWKNKLICGDSLQVVESLIHYEGLKGRVQMIYMDPPYGIDYDSNFQQRIDNAANDEIDRADDVLTIRAFRDTWSLGVHSYLTYLQERLYLCRDLLTDSGSIFFQISEENVHLVRPLLDEVFGRKNFVAQILFRKSGGLTASTLNRIGDYLLWYARDKSRLMYRQLFSKKSPGEAGATQYRFRLQPDGSVEELDDLELSRTPSADIIAHDNITSQGNPVYEFKFRGQKFSGPFKPPHDRLKALAEMGRLCIVGKTLRYVRKLDDFPYFEVNQLWEDTGVSGFGRRKVYAVQTSDLVVERCVAMTTRPSDLVLDPTLGSGTTALVAERLGRRWIGVDSSRVAINVARRELLSAVFQAFEQRGKSLSEDFQYEEISRVTMSSLIDKKEPEKVELWDQPRIEAGAVRVTGPFEVMSLGRYSAEDWRGFVVAEAVSSYGEPQPAMLSNYIEVICRLYRKDAATQGANGLLHAVSESEKEKIAISVGPLSGRVTAKQISDAVEDAMASGILETHVLGWAFEANVGEIKSQLEKRRKVKVELVMIRPDTLAEGLKITNPSTLFSPLALPDIAVKKVKNGKEPHVQVALNGVAVFNRKTRATSYRVAGSGYVAAWYLDEDYDGDCFVDCQMFFDFKKTPNLKAALKAEIDPEEFKLQTESHPFPIRGYKRIAVKVVDVYGNESTVVKELA